MAIAGWQYFTTQKQWEAYLKDLIRTNDKALLRAIVLIHDMQTEEEKAQNESTIDNNIGWSKWDAKEMGDIAKKLKRGEPLTNGELAKSRNKMQKYWKQLMHISKQQQATKNGQEPKALEQKGLQINASEERQLKEEHFRTSLDTLRRCSEDGIACEYGICDECPVTQGLQMRMQLSTTEQ